MSSSAAARFDVETLQRLIDDELITQCTHRATPNPLVMVRVLKALEKIEAHIAPYLRTVDERADVDEPQTAQESRIMSRCCDVFLNYFLAHYLHDAVYIQCTLMSIRLRELVLLCMSKVYALRFQLLPRAKRTRMSARTPGSFLSVCAEEAIYAHDIPIFEMSQHTLMMSLYALYIRTPEAHYSDELYCYMLYLMWRAMQLLVIASDQYVFNVTTLRTACYNGNGLFRFSQRFATDIGVLLRNIMRKFSCVCEFKLVPHVFRSVSELVLANDTDVLAVSRWLRARSRVMPSLFVQQQYSKLMMRAGECDFYELVESSAYVEQAVLQRYRPAQFVQFMEDALRLPQQIIEQELTGVLEGRIVREPVGLSLVALDTLLERLRTQVSSGNAEQYIMLEWQLTPNGSIAGIEGVKRTKHPIVLYAFNAVQLWDGSQLHMYNSALRSLAAFARIVLAPPYNGTLAQCNARAMCEEILGLRNVGGAGASARDGTLQDRRAEVGTSVF